MRSIFVRTTALCSSILIGCGLAWGATKVTKASDASDRDLPSPAHFLALIEKSRLTYEISLHPPKASPVKELSCGERTNGLRRVRSGDDWSLVEWRPATEAAPHLAKAEALLRMGRLDDAETEYVRALVYHPAYDGAWSGLESLGRIAGFQVKRPSFSPPTDALGERQGDKVQIGLAEKDLEWLSYFLCKAVWRNEPEYRRAKGIKSEAYSWSTSEERECLTSYLGGSLALAKANLAVLSPQARHLKEVAEAGLFDGFLIVADLGPRCPVAVPLLPESVLDQAERYIRRFAILRPSSASQRFAGPAIDLRKNGRASPALRSTTPSPRRPRSLPPGG
jgi:tetratricopeptide (TPR) repeat protein